MLAVLSKGLGELPVKVAYETVSEMRRQIHLNEQRFKDMEERAKEKKEANTGNKNIKKAS